MSKKLFPWIAMAAMIAAMLSSPQAAAAPILDDFVAVEAEPIDPRSVVAERRQAIENNIERQQETIEALRMEREALRRRIAYANDRLDEKTERLDNTTTILAEWDKQELWDDGYLQEGGQHLPIFHNKILPCESGGVADPWNVVGIVDPRDKGRAQINSFYWKDRFESRFEVSFDAFIFDPWWNGRAAAMVEQEQGLTAWVCFNK